MKNKQPTAIIIAITIIRIIMKMCIRHMVTNDGEAAVWIVVVSMHSDVSRCLLVVCVWRAASDTVRESGHNNR